MEPPIELGHSSNTCPIYNTQGVAGSPRRTAAGIGSTSPRGFIPKPEIEKLSMPSGKGALENEDIKSLSNCDEDPAVLETKSFPRPVLCLQEDCYSILGQAKAQTGLVIGRGLHPWAMS